MRIAATADIHAPLYTDLFKKALNDFLKRKIDVNFFVIAGDLIERGDINQLDAICPLLDKIDEPIIGCFGNNEYEELEGEIIKKCPRIKFLSDEKVILRTSDGTVGVIGSRGALDKPTYWQMRNIPNIRAKYRERVGRIKKLIKELRTDFKILLIHYPPTYSILEGENPKFFPQMACKLLESSVKDVDLVVTAHAHKGLRMVEVEGVPIYNVALPLNEKIVVLNVEPRKKGLEMFF